MVNPSRFYTYAYLREDRTPYYIGKGSGKRIYVRNRRYVKPPTDKSRVIFLKRNLTEEEAFKHEKYMIAVFGRKDLGTGILHNRTDGGEGSVRILVSITTREKIRQKSLGRKHTEETKKKISLLNSGKNNGMYEKNKELNAFYGKKHTEETRAKMSEKKKGKKHNFYGKTGVLSHNYGRKLTEEHKNKIKNGNLGKVLTEENKKEISNRFKNTIYINNGDICKRIKKDQSIPEGWVRGRLTKQSKSLINNSSK